MDKIAANNYFVILRKEIKKAKAMVSGNLIRKIKGLKKEIDDSKETDSSRIQSKIDLVYDEIKLLKTLDSYQIAKQATLKPGKEHWNKLASNTKVGPEERLTALVICKNNIQRQVSKFRGSHKDCDEWLEEYIEYRERKKELISPIKRKKSAKKETMIKIDKSPNESKQRGANKRSDTSGKTRQNEPKQFGRKGKEQTNNQSGVDEEQNLHPSWQSKRREKELLRAALSGDSERPKKIKFD